MNTFLRTWAAALVALTFVAGCEKPGNDPETTGPDTQNPDGNITLELPADPQPQSTDFSHRIMLLQHTGTYCSNCPRLMSSLKILAEDQAYAGKYQHVAAHSYNETGDAAYSQAAAHLSQAFCSGYYPELTFNLTKDNTGTSTDPETIKAHIDAIYKEVADAGITAVSRRNGRTLSIKAGIKAAKAGTYRIAAWVLEDGIRSKQEGASEDWQNTHNNAVRIMAGKTLNMKIYGEKLDPMAAGETAQAEFTVEMDPSWDADNCKVFVLVNAAGTDGRYDLANCAICPLDGSVEYQYN